MPGKTYYFFGIGVTAHEAHAGNEAFIAPNERVQQFLCQGFSDILP